MLALTSIYGVPVNAAGVSGGVNYLWGGVDENRPQQKMVTHAATGKVVVVAYYDGVTSNYQKLQIKLFGVTGSGSLIDDQTLNLATAGLSFYNHPYDEVMGVTIINYNATSVIIAGTFSYSTGPKIRAFFFSYNVITHVISNVFQSPSGANAAPCSNTALYIYNNKVWLIGKTTQVGWGSTYAYIFALNPTTKAVTLELESTALAGHENNACSQMISFQDPNNLDKIYAMYSIDNVKTAKLYLYTLSGTPSITTIATLGTAYCLEDGASVDDSYTKFFTQINAGIYSTGTYYYMYFTWVYSDRTNWASTGVRYVNIYQQRLKFNNTITSGTLLDTNRKALLTVLDASGSTSASLGFNWGFTESNGSPYPDSIRVFYNSVASGKYVAEVDLGITNWTTFDDTAFDTIQYQAGVDNIDFTYENTAGGGQMIVKDPTKNFSFQAMSNTNCILYTNEMTAVKVYTLTVTATPADSPMLTNKQYDITFQVFVNGVVDTDSDTFAILIDGTERSSGTLSATGTAVYGAIVSVAGTYSFVFKVYDAVTHSLVYTSAATSYTFSASTTPGGGGTEEQQSAGFASVTGLLIPMAVILFPAGVFLSIGNALHNPMVGLLAGLTIGAGLGFYGNVVPIYVLVIVILVDVLCLVFLRPQSSGV